MLGRWSEGVRDEGAVCWRNEIGLKCGLGVGGLGLSVTCFFSDAPCKNTTPSPFIVRHFHDELLIISLDSN